MKFRLLTAFALLFPTVLEAQPVMNPPADSLQEYFKFEDPPLLSCLFTYFPPLFIKHGIDLKSFIRNGTFRTIRRSFGDTRAVDAIYFRSMQLTDNNTAIALLLATIATMDHRVVGIKNPVFKLFFPLSDESSEEFRTRLANLPARFYPDCPADFIGDRDKLQHFFGSAFLTFIFESRKSANRIGEFIEEGEDMFIIDGVLDARDLRADRHGQEFGLALLNDNHRLPSEFLKFELAHTVTDTTGSNRLTIPDKGNR